MPLLIAGEVSDLEGGSRQLSCPASYSSGRRACNVRIGEDFRDRVVTFLAKQSIHVVPQ